MRFIESGKYFFFFGRGFLEIGFVEEEGVFCAVFCVVESRYFRGRGSRSEVLGLFGKFGSF